MSHECTTNYPFLATPEQLAGRIDSFIDATFASLSSFYLELPRGDHFTEYGVFTAAFLALKEATNDFATLDRTAVFNAIADNSLVLVVLRCITGLSPPEIADLSSETGSEVTQGFARSVDQKARDRQDVIGRARPQTLERIQALIEAACSIIEGGGNAVRPEIIHRLNKIDTADGLTSLRDVSQHGIVSWHGVQVEFL